jgi:hypothetical protein
MMDGGRGVREVGEGGVGKKVGKQRWDNGGEESGEGLVDGGREGKSLDHEGRERGERHETEGLGLMALMANLVLRNQTYVLFCYTTDLGYMCKKLSSWRKLVEF